MRPLGRPNSASLGLRPRRWAAQRPWAAAGVALALLPLVPGNPYDLHLLTTVMIYAIALIGLDIVVGHTGQISLGHAGLFGVGAYTTGVLAHNLDAPWWLALPASVGAAAACGALLALPTLRVSGPHLAMVTLGFGTLAQMMFNELGFVTDGPQGRSLPRPVWGDMPLGEQGFFWMVATLLAVVLVLMQRLVASHLGRAFQALRDSPIAADCSGVPVYRYKVLAFVASAGLTGLAGSLHAYSEQYVGPEAFGFELTMWLLVALIMGGRQSRVGALMGAAIVVLLPPWLDDPLIFRTVCMALALGLLAGAAWRLGSGQARLAQVWVPAACSSALAALSFMLPRVADWRWAIFGAITLLVMHDLPDGIVGPLRRLARLRRTPPAPVGQPPPLTGPLTPGNRSLSLLTVRGLVMQFGGLRALDQIDLMVRPGSVHGLIGPNGSGKTTLMNVLGGLVRPHAGRIWFNGSPLPGGCPAAIARAGIGRTFQTVRLFDTMTVLDHVLIGRHRHLARHGLDALLRPRRYRHADALARTRARQLLQFVGLADMADAPANVLPLGAQRLLEIARALALDPQLLLLDEPAAGLPPEDIRHLVTLIGKLREHGVTLLLIEHRMDVVMSVCDIVSVFDFGRKIAEGSPAQVQADPEVIRAYLGQGRLEYAC